MVPPPFPVFSTPPTPSRPRARAAKKACLNGPKCTQTGGRGGHRHALCVWQFCKSCCQGVGQYCPAPQHCISTGTVLNSVTVAPRPTSNSSSPSAPVPFTYERPMGRMVDTSYALKIQRGDHEPATGDRFQRELYRMSMVNATNVRVWLKVCTPFRLYISFKLIPLQGRCAKHCGYGCYCHISLVPSQGLRPHHRLGPVSKLDDFCPLERHRVGYYQRRD